MDPVREHFERRAGDLADCATLEVGQWAEGDETPLWLVPLNPRALGVFLIDSGDGWFDVGWDDPYHCSEEALDDETIDFHLNAAVEGRVRALHGPSRGEVMIDEGDGYQPWSTIYEGGRGLVPRFGWRLRATVVDYEPYRTAP